MLFVQQGRDIYEDICFKELLQKITTEAECVCRVQQATCRVVESETAVVPQVQRASNVSRIVYICTHPNHPNLTPVRVLQIEGGAVSMFSSPKH